MEDLLVHKARGRPRWRKKVARKYNIAEHSIQHEKTHDQTA